MVGEATQVPPSPDLATSDPNATAPASPKTTRRWLVVLNAKAGTAARTKLAGEDPASALKSLAKDAGIDLELVTPEPKSLRSEVRRYLSQSQGAQSSKPFDAVIAAGGDGTVNTVGSAVIEWKKETGSAPAFGVLPLGTFNFFAKTTGVPIEWKDAVAALASAEVQPHNAGFVTGADRKPHLFLCMATMGLHPAMVKDRDAKLKEKPQGRWLGKWPAMLAASWRVLLRFPRHRITLDMPGLEQTVRTPGVYVCPDCSRLEAYGIEKKFEHPTTGPELSILVGKTQTRLSAIWLAFRAVLGKLPGAEGFDLFHTKKVTISTDRSRGLDFVIDGEHLHLKTPVTFELQKDVFPVLVPRLVSAAKNE